MNDKARGAFERSLKAAKPEQEVQFKLNFEGLKVEKPLDFYYEIYLNLPDNVQEPNFKMENYAGNLAFFGAEQTHAKHGEMAEVTISATITSSAKMLKALQQQKTVSVTLVPTGLESREGKRLPVRSEARISVDQVSLSVNQPDK